MTSLSIDIHLRDIPAYSAHVRCYPDRAPLSDILLAGDYTVGAPSIQLQLVTGCNSTGEQAEAEAVAAEQFAAWAADHAAACREHADRLKADAEQVTAWLVPTIPA